MSKPKHIAIMAATVAGFAALPSLAQQSKPAPEHPSPRLEITMTLLPENAKDTREITRKIELPPAGGQPAAEGKRPTELPGADHGKGEGLEKAAEARERGREFGQDVAEQARENRENAGRRDTPPGPPGDRPGNGPPSSPPGGSKP